MKKISWLLCFVAGVAFGQKDGLLAYSLTMDSVGIDTVLADTLPKVNWGVTLDASYNLAPNEGSLMRVGGLGGTVYYENISFGVMSWQLDGEINAQIIFPNYFSLDYRYLEARAGYRIFHSSVLASWLMLSYAQGEAKWTNKNSGEAFEKSNFNLVKAGGIIELSKFNFIRPFAEVGYQKMGSLQLNKVANEGFTGFFLGIGVRVGYFNI